MGKQLIIVGADFSAVAIGTAKVLDYITATIAGTQYTNSAPTGLTVTAYYTAASGGGSSVVTGYTTSPTVWGSTVGQQTMTISYTRGGVTKTTTVDANVQQGGGTMYTVSANITDGTATSVQVASGGTATLTVVPNSGHTNPISVTISSGTATSATISGATITVTNVTSDVVLAATCPSQSGSSINLFPASISTQLNYSSAKELDNFDSYTVVTRAHTEVPDETNNGASYSVNRGTISDLYYQVIYFASTSAQATNVVAWTAVPITNVITLPSSEGYYSIVFKDGSAGTGAMWDQPAGSNPNTCKVSVTQQ